MNRIKNMNLNKAIKYMVIAVLALVALDILGTIIASAPLVSGIVIGVAGYAFGKKLKAKIKEKN